MVIWFIVGLSIMCVWIWCLLFVFSASKGKDSASKHEQKLSPGNMVKTQNVNNSIKGVKKRTSLVPHC